MTAVERLIADLPRTSLVVGKGGVGKTTCAAGLAAVCAQRGERTLLLSTDPAAALADALGSPVSTDVSALGEQPNLDVRQLSAPVLREHFLNRWRSTIGDIIDRGTYLDREDIDGLVEAAPPGRRRDLRAARPRRIARRLALRRTSGSSSIPRRRGTRFACSRCRKRFARSSPCSTRCRDKHRFMVRALTHRYRRDQADDFLDEMRLRIDTLRALLADGDSIAAIVVTRAEALVAAETHRYLERLRDLHVRVAAVIVNAAIGEHAVDVADPSIPIYRLPLAPEPPVGVASVAAAVRALTAIDVSAAPASRRKPAPSRRTRSTRRRSSGQSRSSAARAA